MTEIINLRQHRKAKARQQQTKQADENRHLYGRTKTEKQQQKLEKERFTKHVDGHKLED